MIKKIDASLLVDYQQDRVLIDVRSPAEFAKGHIPGAVNIPLFSDEERAVVGTAYKKVSPENAMMKGLDFVGKKMTYYVKKAKKVAPEKRLIVHCWRGGKRSGSLAWLFELTGFDVVILEGGYKAYRNFVIEEGSAIALSLNVVSGKTGSGKTSMLHELAILGEQIIDLEALANHKGSAFGMLGELAQPSVEHFENLLFVAMSKLDATKRVWVENESRKVGTCVIPPHFFDSMKAGTLWNVQIPHALRVARLVEDYAKYPKEGLVQSFKNIERKLGGQHFIAAIEALGKDDFASAVEIALAYYDKAYQHGLENNITPAIHQLDFDHADMEKIAAALVTEADKR